MTIMTVDTMLRVTPIPSEDNLRERVCYRKACKKKKIYPGQSFSLVDLKSGKVVDMHNECVDKRFVWQSITTPRRV